MLYQAEPRPDEEGIHQSDGREATVSLQRRGSLSNSTLQPRERRLVILSLTTVNRVKGILATLRRRRREERHFALVESF